MKLKYIGRYGGVDIDGVGTVKRGETVEMPEPLASELLERQPSEWEAAEKKSGNKKEAQ